MQECEQPQIEVILSVAVLHCLPNFLERNHLAPALLRRVGRIWGDSRRSRFHETADFLRRTSLHIVSDVRVGVQGKSGAEVAQHTGQGFYIHAAGDSHGRECVPLRYNYDKPGKPRISRVFGYQARFFILFQPEKSSREVVMECPRLYGQHKKAPW